MDKSAAKRNVLFGGMLFLVGLVTVIGAHSSGSGGGRYVVAWGALILGAIRIIRGVTRLKSAPPP